MRKAFGVRVKAVDLLSGHATTPRGCADAVLSAWSRRETQTTAAAAASASVAASAASAAAVNAVAMYVVAAFPAASPAASLTAQPAAQPAALVVASAAVAAEASTGVAVASSLSSSSRSSSSSGRAAARAAAAAPLPAGLELRPSPRLLPARPLHSQRPSATPVAAGSGSPPTPGSRSLAACGPVLVTGGTGFLGAHFVLELLDAPEVTLKQEKKLRRKNINP
jgi:hypothetical protein